MSPNGTDVYVAYETTSDVWVAASHNGGTSFTAAVKLNTDSGRYRYPNGLEVLPNGTALLSASSYPGAQQQLGAVDIEIWKTHERRDVVDADDPGEPVHRRDVGDVLDDRARERRGGHARGALHRCDRPGWERPRMGAAFDR